MNNRDLHPLLHDFEDFFENALCGLLLVDPEGNIIRCNSRLAGWLGRTAASFPGTRLSAILSMGGKILIETHLAPLLRMQGFFEEVSLQLQAPDGQRLDVLMNAQERRDENDRPLFTRIMLYKATDRHLYEANLRRSKDLAESNLLDARETALLREQFIAVLGHDLRNPLGALVMGTALLENAALTPQENTLLKVMQESAARINEMISNVMDFARGRLGGGMSLELRDVFLPPALNHVIEELRVAHPGKFIEAEISLETSVSCDPARVSQILSNLLANALTHGAPDQPVRIQAFIRDGSFHLSVANAGKQIPPETLCSLFQPFTRETVRSSQNGLGLGLYIAAEIARAHGGALAVDSTPSETRFTFTMPVNLSGA